MGARTLAREAALQMLFAVEASGTDVETAPATNAVVASFVLLSPPVGVGAVGTPVNAGDASGAFRASAVVARVASAPVAASA